MGARAETGEDPLGDEGVQGLTGAPIDDLRWPDRVVRDEGPSVEETMRAAWARRAS